MALSALNTTPKAFHNAVGYGRFATGGAGQTLRRVTTTAASGAGSLADALASGAGYIRLEVEGEIALSDEIVTSAANVTIDGRHAPGLGCAIVGARLNVKHSNVILTDVRFYPGSRRSGQTYGSRDGLSIGNFGTTTVDPGDSSITALQVADVYIRECEGWAGVDETFTVWSAPDGTVYASNDRKAERITYDRCLVAEHLHFPYHLDEGASPGNEAPHPNPWLIGDGNGQVTIYRCACIGGDNRNPQIKAGADQVEIVNFLCANFGPNGVQLGGRNDQSNLAKTVIENSIFLAGPETTSPTTRHGIVSDEGGWTLAIDNRVGTFVSGETVTGGTSGATATVEHVSSSRLWFTAAPSAAWQDNEQITGGTSSATADANGTGTAPVDCAYIAGNVFASRVAGAFSDAGLIDGVRLAGPNRAVSSTYYDDPAIITRSNVTAVTADEALFDSLMSDIGARYSDGSLHPITQRVIDYTSADTPFQAAEGYPGINPADEFALVGVTVTGGSGSLTVTVPTAFSSQWSSVVIQAVASAETPAGGSPDWSSPTTLTSGVATTGLSAGWYSVRLVCTSATGGVFRLESGLAWGVT